MNPGPSAVPNVVLVVEDDSFIRMLAADILQDEGFTVLEVATADEAWPILESRSDIEVLFTDVNMPGRMDGLTLATRVAERWPRIRLILTSGRQGLTDDEIPDHGRFVQKPYRQRELVSAISHAG
ncbi:response regulator receiver protein [Methylobacterium sp. GXF4]|uniref:response regulator n=1 Tax=Methylobacterium sp. GXF4 TaxID=1096546 RepID=UPI000269A8B3|nr:response regulator [Methylobacterium sp. GXF4]EIZ86853.1 response regulator receiver protein [Methylobacterium sp. GXF4]